MAIVTRAIMGLFVTLLSVAVSGCARPDSFGGYFADRGRDFAESFRISGGAAWGVHVRVDALLDEVGFGLARGHKFGWDGAAGVGRAHWRKIGASAWLPIVFNYHVDARGVDPDADLGPFLMWRFGDRRPPTLPAETWHLHGQAIVTGYNWHCWREEPPKGTRVGDLYWIEADATVILVSFRFGLNVAEFVDWLGGQFFLVDMLGDDRHLIGDSATEEDGD